MSNKTENQPDSEQPSYVGLQARLLASFIDSILSLLLIAPIIKGFNNNSTRTGQLLDIQNRLASGQIDSGQAMVEMMNYYQGIIGYTAFELVIVGVVIIVFWVSRSATPGKILLNMKIINVKDGGKPTKMALIARYFGYFLSTIPGLLGFLWIAIDKRKQGWHDKIAGTAVVYTRKITAKDVFLTAGVIIVSIFLLGFI